MSDFLLVVLALFFAAVAVVLALTAFLAWRIWRSDERALAKRIRRLPLRGKIALGFGLFADRRAPSWARLLVVGLTLYLVLPFDLIPDFIPVLGLIDDFVIVLFAAGLIIRSVPDYVIEEHLGRLETEERSGDPRTGSRDFDGTVISRHDGTSVHDPAGHPR